MKTNQLQARSRLQRRQTLQEFLRRHPDVRGVVAEAGLTEVKDYYLVQGIETMRSTLGQFAAKI